MTAVSDYMNGVQVLDTAPAEGHAWRAERVEGPESVPQPPPPPPAPKRQRLKASGWLDKLPLRYQLIGAGVVVFGATVVFARLFVHPVDEEAIAAAATQAAVEATRGEVAAARAEATQVAVPTPFSWAKCPMTFEAMGLIGGDPNTGGKTINPDRAAPLEQQAQALLVAFTLPDLRLVSLSKSQLQVVADSPTAGVALFSCLPGNSTSPTVPVATTAAS
jgi:hypothetical protein